MCQQLGSCFAPYGHLLPLTFAKFAATIYQYDNFSWGNISWLEEFIYNHSDYNETGVNASIAGMYAAYITNGSRWNNDSDNTGSGSFENGTDINVTTIVIHNLTSEHVNRSFIYFLSDGSMVVTI